MGVELNIDALLGRVRLVRNLLSDLVEGKKLELDPTSQEGALITKFLDELDLDAPSFFYRVTPEDREDPRKLRAIMEADTSVHLLSTDLIDRSRKMAGFLSERDIQNVRTFGADIRFRPVEGLDLEGLYASADNFVLASADADIVACLQAFELMTRQLQAIHDCDFDDPSLSKQVVIDNERGAFTGLLKLAGLDHPKLMSVLAKAFKQACEGEGEEVLPSPRIAVVNGLDALSNVLLIDGVMPKMALDNDAVIMTSDMEGPRVASFASGNQEKHHDFVNNVQRGGFPLKYRHIHDTVGLYLDGNEFRGTFSANNADKHQVTIDRVNVVYPAGNTPDLFFSSDGGFVFRNPAVTEHFLTDAEYAEHLQTIVHPESGFPGPETKDVLTGAGGKKQFFGDLVDYFAAHPEADSYAIEHCTFMVTDLSDRTNPKTYGVRTKAEVEFIDEFRPADDPDISGRHCSRPPGSHYTIAELVERGSDYATTNHAFGKAYRYLMSACGVPSNSYDHQMNQKIHPDYVLTTDQGVQIESDSIRPKMELSDDITLSGFEGAIRTIDDLRAFTQSAEAFALYGRAVDPERETLADRLLIDWLLPITLFVNRQDKTLRGPVVMRRRNHSDVLAVLTNYLARGTIGDRLKDIVHLAYSNDQMREQIEAAARMWKPDHITIPEHPDLHIPTPDVDVVSLFLSASSNAASDLDDAYTITKNFHLNGLGVLTGWGGVAPMGQTTYASLEMIADGHPVWMGGVQSYHLTEKEGYPIEATEAFFGDLSQDDPDETEAPFFVAPDRLKRIEHLIEAKRLTDHYERTGEAMNKVYVALKAGAGTLEEILIPLYLKIQGHPAFTNTTFVMYNKDGIQDPFLNYINGFQEELGIRAVNSLEEVMMVVEQALGREMTYFSPEEYPEVKRSQEIGLYPFEGEKNPQLKSLLERLRMRRQEVLAANENAADASPLGVVAPGDLDMTG